MQTETRTVLNPSACFMGPLQHWGRVALNTQFWLAFGWQMLGFLYVEGLGATEVQCVASWGLGDYQYWKISVQNLKPYTLNSIPLNPKPQHAQPITTNQQATINDFFTQLGLRNLSS